MSVEYVLPLLSMNLKPTLRIVALMLADEKQRTSGIVEISYERLAQKSCVNRRTAIDAVKRLQKLDYVEVVHRGGLTATGCGEANTFRLRWPPKQRSEESALQRSEESALQRSEENDAAAVKNIHPFSTVRTTEETTRESAAAAPPRPLAPSPPSQRKHDPPKTPQTAFQGQRVYVPMGLHEKLLRLRNHTGADAELRRWYGDVDRELTIGNRALENVEPDMFRFWLNEYRQRWPPPTPKMAKAAALLEHNTAALQRLTGRG